MVEINLMKKYPVSKRNLDERAALKTEEQKNIARKFGEEYFDGDRMHGYGGHYYHPRFWTEVVQDFISHYNLTKESKVLDVGCAKGFMLFNLREAVPGITIRGIDISPYAIDNAKLEVKSFLSVGDAKNLGEFKDKEYDLVTSITTVHNLSLGECKKSLREIQRVGKNAFITVDAFRNGKEKEGMNKWNLTALTYMHVDDWKELFKEVGYTGDYYWFIP